MLQQLWYELSENILMCVLLRFLLRGNIQTRTGVCVVPNKTKTAMVALLRRVCVLTDRAGLFAISRN